MPQRDVSLFRPRIAAAIRIASVEDGYIVFDPERDLIHHLNATAALILELCDGSRTAQQIRDGVSQLAPAAHVTVADVEAWLQTASSDGLITGDRDRGTADSGSLTGEDLTVLATRLQEEGKTSTALLCLRRAVQLAPQNSQAWYALGELAHIEGDRKLARNAYETYLRQQPGDAEIEHMLVALRDQPPPPRASDESVRHLYRRFADFYDESMRGELDYEAPERLLDALSAWLPAAEAGLDVLDLGCGTGLFGSLIQPWAGTLSGVDLSSDMVDRARQRAIYSDLHVAEITQWLAADGPAFDLITACEVLIYFGNLNEILFAMARRLAPRGLVGLTLERGSSDDFQFTDSGRYAHSSRHLSRAAAAAGLQTVHRSDQILRYEYGEPVVGHVAVLQAAGDLANARCT